MDTIAELFSRNILGKEHTDEELRKIVQRLREKRRQFALEEEAKAAAKAEEREAKAAAKAKERKRKAAAAAAEWATRKRDPRQLDLEALAVSAGDTEKDAPQH